jgi:hypothetical protein
MKNIIEQNIILDLFEIINNLSIFDIEMIRNKNLLSSSCELENNKYKIFKEIICLPFYFKIFDTDLIIGFYSEFDTCIYINFDGISYTQNIKAKEFVYPCCGIIPLFKRVIIEDLNEKDIISPIYVIQMTCNEYLKDILFKYNYYTCNSDFSLSYYNKKTFIFHTPDDFFDGNNFIYIPTFETEDEFKKRILQKSNIKYNDYKIINRKNNLLIFLSLYNSIWKDIRVYNNICILINNKINKYRLIFEHLNLNQTSLCEFI